MSLRGFFWPRGRWYRIRNLSFAVFAGLGITMKFLHPAELLGRTLGLVGLLTATVCAIYAYEAWRRDRPHSDTYSGQAQVLVQCSDPEQHDRHHPMDAYTPSRWPDLEVKQ